jgi:hypothetical protein
MRITPRQALAVIHDIAEHEGFSRCYPMIGISDAAMDTIYRVAHAAIAPEDCGDGHKDWHAEALAYHKTLVGVV